MTNNIHLLSEEELKSNLEALLEARRELVMKVWHLDSDIIEVRETLRKKNNR